MTTKRPARVLLVTTDHMRFDCIAAHGNAVMHTPNIDRLVNNGGSYTNCFSQNPVCMPSRASFMTGLYPQQTGVTWNGHCLPDNFPLVAPRLFEAGGYETAQIGKLHLQPHEDNDLDSILRNRYGFGTCWISEEGGCYDDTHTRWLRLRYPEHANAFVVPRSTAPERGEWENKVRVVNAPWQATHSGFVTDSAIRYLSKRQRSPVFAHLGFFSPHPPLTPPAEAFEHYRDATIPLPRRSEQEWADKPEPMASMLKSRAGWSEQDFVEYRRAFYALVTEVDLALGSLFAWLDAHDMMDDSLIVFTSDHGDMCGDHGMTHKAHHFLDEVMHVPYVLHWPDGFGTGARRAEGLAELVDMLPTLLDLSGCRVPRQLVGESHAESLLAGTPPAGKEGAYAFAGEGNAMLRTMGHKYIRYVNGGEVLFDLSDDRHEVVNHAKDPSFASVLADMRTAMLDRTLRAGASPLSRAQLW